MVTFTVMPNSLVHVLMYSYYLLSSLDNAHLQKRLAMFKRYLTRIQMVSAQPARGDHLPKSCTIF